MYTQEFVRDELKKYLKENGVKAKFVATKMNVSEATMSYFLKKNNNLCYENIAKLSAFLEEKGYCNLQK